MKKIDKYFFRYNKICKEIIMKELELDNLQSTTITTPKFTAITNESHSSNGLEVKLIHEENLIEEIKKLYLKKANRRKRHVLDFKKLSKPEYEIILTCYYLDNASIKNIASKLDKTVGHIKKLKREALKELSEILNFD